MNIKQLIPKTTASFDSASTERIKSSYPLSPFDKRTIDFISELSKEILSDNEYNRIPAFTALGFWLRKSNIDRIHKENIHLFNNASISCSPAGLVFHVCPSNVDTIFIYSLVVSLLAGNKNIIRLSHRTNHPYIQFIIDKFNFLLEKPENNVLREYIYIVSYEHEDEINSFFSEIADIRMIWGGNNTINLFRNIKTNPRTKDIVFADRLSYAIFNSSEILKLSDNDLKELVRKFYNDSFTFDQLGCSSPQLIFFKGDDEDNLKAKQKLYKLLLEISIRNYDADMPSITSLKFNKLVDDVLDGSINGYYSDDFHLVFAPVEENKNIEHSCGAGYFYTKDIKHWTEITPFISKKIQTITYFGFANNEIIELIKNIAGLGCDRIVPVGKALEFDYIWDGYNLLDELLVKRKIL